MEQSSTRLSPTTWFCNWRWIAREPRSHSVLPCAPWAEGSLRCLRHRCRRPAYRPWLLSNVPPLDENALRAAAARTAVPAPRHPCRRHEFRKDSGARVETGEIIGNITCSDNRRRKRFPQNRKHPDVSQTSTQRLRRPRNFPQPASPRPRTIAQNPAPASQPAPETVPTWPTTPAQAAPPAAADKSLDRTGAIEVARLVSRDDPVYPQSAKELGLGRHGRSAFQNRKRWSGTRRQCSQRFRRAGRKLQSKQFGSGATAQRKSTECPTESEASAVFVFKKS